MLYQSPPKYDHQRTFGCLCFMSSLKHGRSKFEPRAQPCIFLGYPIAKKAYKIYNLITNKIHYSRDVVPIFVLIFSPYLTRFLSVFMSIVDEKRVNSLPLIHVVFIIYFVLLSAETHGFF